MQQHKVISAEVKAEILRELLDGMWWPESVDHAPGIEAGRAVELMEYGEPCAKEGI
jgi:hypothetical protein